MTMLLSWSQVHFFRPVPKEYLHSAELRDIMQFGSSNAAVFFKMRVAGVLHIFQFETKQVQAFICSASLRKIYVFVSSMLSNIREISIYNVSFARGKKYVLLFKHT